MHIPAARPRIRPVPAPMPPTVARVATLGLLGLFGLVALTVTTPPAAAQIQTGPFESGSTWFLGPGGTTGLAPSGAQITRVSDGAVFNRPTEIQDDPDWNLLFRLSPSQQVLYVQKSNPQFGQTNVCNGFPNVQILLYDMSSPPALTPFTSVSGPACLDGGVDIQPRFFDRSGTVRTLVAVGAGTGNAKQFLWADLVGQQMGIDASTYSGNVGRIQFSPSGNAAYIEHSLPPGTPTARYNFVDLCENPLGGNPGAPQTLPAGAQTAEVVESGGTFFAQLAGVTASDVELSTACFAALGGCCFLGSCTPDTTPADCVASGGTPIPDADCSPNPCAEACCLPDGACAVLTTADCSAAGGMPDVPGADDCDFPSCPQPNEACCTNQGVCFNTSVDTCLQQPGGTPLGPGTACSDGGGIECPVLQIDVTKNGPATVRLGDTFDYTIDYDNVGDLDAADVAIVDSLPFGLTLVAASGGGELMNFDEVHWNVGDVPAGTQGQVGLTVLADCFASSFVNNTVSVQTGGLQFSDFAGTQILPELADPVDPSVVTTTSNGLPVEGGDLLTHTITLTNSAAEPRPGIGFTLGVDSGLTLESVLDDGGGTVETFSAQQWDWTGDLPASGSVTVVVTSRVDSCVQQREVRFQELYVYTGCGTDLGVAPAQTFPVRRALEVDAFSDSLAPPTTLETFITSGVYQALREGQTVDFRLVVENPHPTSRTVDAGTSIPFGFEPVGDPPFVAPTDPGAVWNAVSHTIQWSGTLAAGASVEIGFRAVQTQVDQRSSGINASAGDGTCTIFDGKGLAVLPTPPANPYLVALQGSRVVLYEPGVDSDTRVAFPFTDESTTGMARAANGDIWVVSLPAFRLNLETIELEGLPVALIGQLGFNPQDVAVDPTDGTVIFAGSVSGQFGSVAALRRYDPSTGTLTPVFQEPLDQLAQVGFVSNVVVEPGGEIGMQSANGRLFRYDPVADALTELTDPAFVNYLSLGLDPEDGSYLAAEGAFSQTALGDIDPSTGTHDTVTADLQALLPSGQFPPRTLAGGADGEIWVGYRFSGLAHIERQPTVSATELIPFDIFGQELEQLEYASPGPCADADGDGAGVGAGCSGAQDCDDGDGSVAPGAVEIADGQDNQCPGDAGFGLTDELPGLASWSPGQPLCWPASAGATSYDVARFVGPSISGTCMLFSTAATCREETAEPPPGGLWVYLVRVSAPVVGSWGRDSTGAERTPTCP